MNDTNNKVSEIFRKMADLLELDGANRYRIRSYRRAARQMASLDQNIEHLMRTNIDVSQVTGLEQHIVKKIQHILKKGFLPEMNELRLRLPAIFTELLDLPGLEPQHVFKLYLDLNIRSMDDLKAALEMGQVSTLSGFDENRVDTLVKALE